MRYQLSVVPEAESSSYYSLFVNVTVKCEQLNYHLISFDFPGYLNVWLEEKVREKQVE